MEKITAKAVLITPTEICKKYGFCRSTFYRIVERNEDFPQKCDLFPTLLRYNRKAIIDFFHRHGYEPIDSEELQGA